MRGWECRGQGAGCVSGRWPAAGRWEQAGSRGAGYGAGGPVRLVQQCQPSISRRAPKHFRTPPRMPAAHSHTSPPLDSPPAAPPPGREFFQCDFDVAGTYPTMVADAEVLKVLTEILGDLALGEFTVKLNHRRLLDAMLAIAGVPEQKFR